MIRRFEPADGPRSILLALAFATALAVLTVTSLAQDPATPSPEEAPLARVLTGVVLGVLVSVTSIGAGAIGTVALFFLYPRIPTVRIVGSDIAHAVPLTFVAGLGHLALGSVNIPLLLSLLLGSLPGIYIGSHLSTGVPDKVLRPVLAGMLILIGSMMIVPVIKNWLATL